MNESKTPGPKKKRKSISIDPILWDNVRKIVYVKRTDISNVISKQLEQYVIDNQQELMEYDELNQEN